MKKITLITFVLLTISIATSYGQNCENYKDCKTQTQRAQFIVGHLMMFFSIKIDHEKDFKSLSEIQNIVKTQAIEIKGATIDETIDAAIKAKSEGNMVFGFVGNAHFFALNEGTVESGNWKRKMPLVFDLPWKNTDCDDSKGLNFFCGSRENNFKITFYKTKQQ